MATSLNIPNYTVSHVDDDLNKSFRVDEADEENENKIPDILENEELIVMLRSVGNDMNLIAFNL
jgi:hypothetical protein